MARRVGIIGSGEVGQTLAVGFRKNGWEVKIGSRNPHKLADWAAGEGSGVGLGTFEEVAAFGDPIVLAVKGDAAVEAIELAGLSNLDGKTVIDATNPISNTPPIDGVLAFFTGPNESLMERLQQHAPAAKFVKAYNSVGSDLMVNPALAGGRPSMFICGNDDSAKAEVKAILADFGWDTEDMGTAVAARAIEPLCILWCISGFLNNDWTHAFKVVRKS